MDQLNKKTIASENARFWDELCGSQLAKYLGVTDSTPESLKRFDKWYFDFYPYLDKHIDFENLNEKKVLEIGLGYGTVSQKLAESGAIYTGLDIAAGPVNMVNHRLSQNNLGGSAIKGSILEPKFGNETFDVIIAIGCLHHTGDLRQAIENCMFLLRPGGRLTFMVYYSYSYRRWMQASIDTLKYFFSELRGWRGVVGASVANQRAAYDKSVSGEGAPHTDWISKKSLADMCSKYSKIKMQIENIDVIPPFKFWSRAKLLNTKIPNAAGLDLYVTVIK
jgi:2-polyprenyl-3-methyl-5-hydroxy-6-metoxy-1,4-benzoquinol methylase